MTQEEIDRLRRLHKIEPGRAPYEGRVNIRRGGTKHPLPDWVVKWIKNK